MAFAEASLSTLFVGKSATKDVEPTTYQTMQPTAHSISPTSGSFEDETIDPSGDAIDQFRINKSGQGDISGHWRPFVWDSMVECAMRSEFSAAVSLTPTVDFSVPSALGLQTITDNGANGLVTVLKGDSILIANAVAAGNNGLKLVVARDGPGDVVTIYNPGGATATADVISITHQGGAALGTTQLYAWIERFFTDGTSPFYSEWFKNGKITSWALDFPAQAPTRVVFGVQSDPPVILRANGAPPIVKQRGGTDVAVTGDRLVHGMEDVREIILYDSVGGVVKRFDDTTAANFGFTINRQVRQDAVLGTSNIVNTSVSRPKIEGRLSAFLDDNSSYLVSLWNSYPDDMQLHVIFGATDATCYGVWFDQVRMQANPTPVGGNNQAVTINGTFSATKARVTRF